MAKKQNPKQFPDSMGPGAAPPPEPQSDPEGELQESNAQDTNDLTIAAPDQEPDAAGSEPQSDPEGGTELRIFGSNEQASLASTPVLEILHQESDTNLLHRYRANWLFSGFRTEPLNAGDEVLATEAEAAPYLGRVLTLIKD